MPRGIWIDGRIGTGGGLGASPVAGAIGWELGGRSPSSPPSTVSSLAFIRSNGSLEIPLMFRPELLHAKDMSNLGASFGAYSERVLSGTSDECVPEGRALFPFER